MPLTTVLTLANHITAIDPPPPPPPLTTVLALADHITAIDTIPPPPLTTIIALADHSNVAPPNHLDITIDHSIIYLSQTIHATADHAQFIQAHLLSAIDHSEDIIAGQSAIALDATQRLQAQAALPLSDHLQTILAPAQSIANHNQAVDYLRIVSNHSIGVAEQILSLHATQLLLQITAPADHLNSPPTVIQTDHAQQAKTYNPVIDFADHAHYLIPSTIYQRLT